MNTKIVQKFIQPILLALSLLFTSFAVFASTPGVLDPSFGEGGIQTTTIGDNSEIFATAVQPDGKIVAVGSAYNGSNGEAGKGEVFSSLLC